MSDINKISKNKKYKYTKKQLMKRSYKKLGTNKQQQNIKNKHFDRVSYTYVLNSNFLNLYGLNEKILINIFAKLNINRSVNPNKKHLFGFSVNKNFFNTKFVMQDRFNNRIDVVDKLKLYLNCKKYFPIIYKKYLPDSRQLTYDSKINWGKNIVYLAKPVQERAGKGIIYLTDNKSLDYAKKQLKNNNGSFILSQYIINPLLFRGKKMHVRAYLLFTLINNVFKTYLLKDGEIITAKKPYKPNEFNNLDIHDTHGKSTDDFYIFPEDLIKYKSIPNMEIYEKIYDEMRNSLNMVSRIAAMNFISYTNADNSYNIFGMDYIITDDYNVKIIEINDIHTGYGNINTDINNFTYNKIQTKYWNWVKECVILPTLNYNYIPNRNDKSNIPITTFYILNDM
jgi:hypothetical protein